MTQFDQHVKAILWMGCIIIAIGLILRGIDIFIYDWIPDDMIINVPVPYVE